MSCFNKVSTITANRDLDTTKHVNYTSGMILGVDDFTQEFAYLAGRDRWLARETLGYGTVSGLRVQIDADGAKGARVRVDSGVAISPRGQMICVPTPQCAYLNEWLAANQERLRDPAIPETVVSPPLTSPPSIDELKLFVVLCYRDCPVDNVPIPGEPCRSEDELSAPSRIVDDFSLELRLEAPAQPEEDAVREFVDWFGQIKIVETGVSTAIEDFIEAVRDLASAASPPVISSPPTDLQISAADFADYARAAFRLWVTELRIARSGRDTGCAREMSGGRKFEDCVLLAELRVPLVSVSTGYKVSDSEPVTVGEEQRPVLLHLRMLQELLLLRGVSKTAETVPPVTSPPVTSPPLSEALDDLSDVEISSPADGQVLVFDGSKWINKTPETGGGSAVTDHGNLVGLGDDDHDQYFLTKGTRALTGNLDAGTNRIVNLKAADNNGEAVVYEQAIKQDDDAKGDLGGKYPAPIVTALQGSKISATKPKADEILIFKDGVWTPQPQPVVSAPQPQREALILPFAKITRVKNPPGIRTPAYEIWFNIDAPGNLVRVSEINRALQILDENNQPRTFLEKGFPHTLTESARNVFSCVITSLTPNPTFPTLFSMSGKLRFRFNLAEIGVEIFKPAGDPEKMTLAQYAEKFNIRFSGSTDGKIVTIFVRDESVSPIDQ